MAHVVTLPTRFDTGSWQLVFELLYLLHLRELPDVAMAIERYLLSDLPANFERSARHGGAWRLTPQGEQLVRVLIAIAQDQALTADNCRAAIRQAVLMDGCKGTPS